MARTSIHLDKDVENALRLYMAHRGFNSRQQSEAINNLLREALKNE